jgi:hypothetical protein
MKGRRKVKTCKWFLKAQFVLEAQHMNARRSKKVAHRFLDAASQFGAEHEPIGRLAGGSSPPLAKQATNLKRRGMITDVEFDAEASDALDNGIATLFGGRESSCT